MSATFGQGAADFQAGSVSEPETVAVRASSLNPAYSSVNAQVLSDAAKVDYSFAASLDPNVDTVTRLQSSYTQQVGDENLRVGDAVSSSSLFISYKRPLGSIRRTRAVVEEFELDLPQGLGPSVTN